eukprot:15475656-Alexandrium_andersonii.AAC.1
MVQLRAWKGNGRCDSCATVPSGAGCKRAALHWHEGAEPDEMAYATNRKVARDACPIQRPDSPACARGQARHA